MTRRRNRRCGTSRRSERWTAHHIRCSKGPTAYEDRNRVPISSGHFRSFCILRGAISGCSPRKATIRNHAKIIAPAISRLAPLKISIMLLAPRQFTCWRSEVNAQRCKEKHRRAILSPRQGHAAPRPQGDNGAKQLLALMTSKAMKHRVGAAQSATVDCRRLPSTGTASTQGLENRAGAMAPFVNGQGEKPLKPVRTELMRRHQESGERNALVVRDR